MARLAVLIPRPRVNLLLYYGVLAPRAAWRREIVPSAPASVPDAKPDQASIADAAPLQRGWRWAVLMRRVFAIDVLACSSCGGRLRLVALLEASEVTQRILRHLNLPTELPAPTPARPPPDMDDRAA